MTKYQNLFSTALFILAGMFLFTACDKEDLDDYENGIDETVNTVITGQDLTNGMQAGDSSDCFEIVFPIDLDVPGTGVVTINDYMTLETTLDNYYDTNPDTEDDPLPVFPVDVILEDGTQQSITNEDELEELFEDCFGDDWEDGCDDEDEDDDKDHDDDEHECDEDWEDEFCLDLVYPVSVNLPDGTTLTANDEEELEDGIDDFYDANPNLDDEEFELVFPVDVELPDGTAATANNEDELWDLVDMHCEDDWEDDDEECFEINFPVTIIFSDGSTVTVNNEDEAEDAEDAFEDANPDLDDDYTLEFPIDVTLEDGSIQSIADEVAFEALEDSCD